MSTEIYAVLSLGMRYVFTALGALIVLRAFLWLRRDRREKHERLRRLPDAGMIGELLPVPGTAGLPEDVCYAVPREGTLGAQRTCDVCIPAEGIAREHLDLSWQDGRGLRVTPLRGLTCLIDGEEVTRARPGWMAHGSTLAVGGALLRLRLFEGVEAEYRPRARAFDDEAADASAPDAWTPPEDAEEVEP